MNVGVYISKLADQGIRAGMLGAMKCVLRASNMGIERRQTTVLCRKKIAQMYSYHHLRRKGVDIGLLNEHVKIWKPLAKKVNTKWIQVYVHVSGIKSAIYVPEDIYCRVVQPCLNYRPMLKAFSDKNLYEKDFSSDMFPNAVVRNIDGVFYNNVYAPITGRIRLDELLNGCHKVIVKPSIDSSGGKFVELFTNTGTRFINAKGDKLSVSYLERHFQKNYVIQERLVQHESLSRLNHSSVNTIRIYTYRSVINEELVILDAVLRIGQPGSVVDNQRLGGLSVGINNDGVLNNFAVDKMGTRYYTIGGVDLTSTHKVLGFKKMTVLAKRIAKIHVYERLLGLDMTLDNNMRVKLIEVNNHNIGINLHQMNNGPLFKKYTDEIIQYCTKKNAKGIWES